MGFELQINESAAVNTRRILTEQVDKAITSLNKPDGDLDDGIHSARKSIKRIRAILRLVRDDIGTKTYKRHNTAFRNLARDLAGARDSKVLLDTLVALIEEQPKLDQGTFAAIRQHLQAEYEAKAGQLDEKSEVIASATDAFNDAQKRINAMTFSHNGFKAFKPGLQRTYSTGRVHLWMAHKHPTAEAFHEWRKYVKYLWHQVEVLGPMWPSLLVPYADELHTLSDYLGDDHDFAVLKQTLYDLPADVIDGEAVYQMSNIIDGKRLRLEKAAFQLGKRLYAEETEPFVERLNAYWQTWSREAKPTTVSG